MTTAVPIKNREKGNGGLLFLSLWRVRHEKGGQGPALRKGGKRKATPFLARRGKTHLNSINKRIPCCSSSAEDGHRPFVWLRQAGKKKRKEGKKEEKTTTTAICHILLRHRGERWGSSSPIVSTAAQPALLFREGGGRKKC